MLNIQLLGSTLENKNLIPLLSNRISHVFKLFLILTLGCLQKRVTKKKKILPVKTSVLHESKQDYSNSDRNKTVGKKRGL